MGKDIMSAAEYRQLMKRTVPISKEKAAMEQVFRELQSNRVIDIVSEHKFHPTRKWRFDWAIPEYKIAVEYEGLFSAKSRHTTISGFSKDCEKYNAAALLGWMVLRYTASTYKAACKDIEAAIELRKGGLV